MIGSKNFWALSKPLLAPSLNSGLNLIVEPFEPPVLEDLSKVPEACHANLTSIGPIDPSSCSEFGKISSIASLTKL